MNFNAIMTFIGIVFMSVIIGITAITFMKNVNAQFKDDDMRW